MAGDLPIPERLVFSEQGAASLLATGSGGRLTHRYGRLGIVAADATDSPGVAAIPGQRAAEVERYDLTEVERLGLQAYELRDSAQYRTAKDNRPRNGETWDMPGCTSVVDVPPPRTVGPAVDGGADAPTSAYLEGSVAVGIVIVEGPGALAFTPAERIKVVAEVQNGLGWLAAANPPGGISFSYDVRLVTLTLAAGGATGDQEAYWRDPTMGALGFSADFNGVRDYVERLRTTLHTRWTYCGFFTKYPIQHFAYASIGGPRLVMDYANDGWGPDNIDRVFAHESGHIFGCPDEYASSGCDCGGAWGRFGMPNGNCANCAPGGGVQCLMKANDFTMCRYTPAHLGWQPRLAVPNFGYTAGGWRVEKHPRLLADTTGDGRADIVGFGDAGVYVSRASATGSFGPVELAVGNFGYTAGGWRVEKHPRFLADTTGDGRADIVGFGDAGVYVSRAQASGAFTPLTRVIDNFGYTAGGWRIEKHPRFLADTTGDGRADIVGFGDAGVYVSRANADGTYSPLQLVVANFGYTAGGWRVEQHPRYLADVTGDGRADIVGFGDAGVWVSYARVDGTFTAPQLVVANFGYSAGGWRVDKHPRVLADVTGDGRADIVGFGDAGVWVSRAQPNGTFAAPQLGVTNFGYSAGNWRVESHPRFLADTTGDGRADIVGFGDAGVWVSQSNGDGSFAPPKLVVNNFAIGAGGWQVTRHPRFAADTTGDGRADIVGCGDAGVWIWETTPTDVLLAV